ncbi:hypothetical protein V8G54_037489 [Vigna mungo]|uniref:Uncharacterized protein n=1 Tax=Vigna mungo TaxID=3915 RepID=A0AAQ3RHI9_VIGMU
MASSSTKRPRRSRKGNETATEPKAATYVRPSVAEQLDQCRFFSDNHQMEHYPADFYIRNIIVNKRRIRLKHADWLNVANEFPYDREMALATMVRQEMQGQHVQTVDCLDINDKLLHYVIVHMLTPRPGNFVKLLHEDIFMLWVLKTNIDINWSHHIMQHMIKCKAGDTPLPYNEDQPHHHENLVQPPPHLSNPNMMTQMWEGTRLATQNVGYGTNAASECFLQVTTDRYCKRIYYTGAFERGADKGEGADKRESVVSDLTTKTFGAHRGVRTHDSW